MNDSQSLEVAGSFASRSPLPLSIVSLSFRGAVRVEVAVHSVLRNHGMAESAFIRAAAAAAAAAWSCRQLRPHINCITQLGAPERLQESQTGMDYLSSKMSTFFLLTYAPALGPLNLKEVEKRMHEKQRSGVKASRLFAIKK